MARELDLRLAAFVSSFLDPYAAHASSDAIDCMRTFLEAMVASHPVARQLTADLVAQPLVQRSDAVSDVEIEEAKKRTGSKS